MPVQNTVVGKLKREINKMRKDHDKELVKLTVNHLEEMEAQKDIVGDQQSKIRGFESDKRMLQKDLSTVRSQRDDAANFISQLEQVFREQQRDMKTVCEAIYGSEFNPEWQGDGPIPNMWQGNIEYAAVDSGPDLDLDPMQRLMHMIWRRGHWALNPMFGNRSWESRDGCSESPSAKRSRTICGND